MSPAGFDGFGAFGNFPHDENGCTHGGRFFLHAAGVRKDERGALHEMDEFGIGKRVREENTRLIAELGSDGGADGGVGVNGQDSCEVREFFCKGKDCGADLFERSAEIFATVGGYEENFAGEFFEAHIGITDRRGKNVV